MRNEYGRDPETDDSGVGACQMKERGLATQKMNHRKDEND